MSLRAAVIGVGAMGRHHARVYDQLAETELVGVADADAATAELVAGRYRVPAYTDHRRLLEEQAPEIVSLVVPTSEHLRVGLDALSAGAALLVEKPIASTLDEASALIEAAAAAGRPLGVGHIERFNPAVTELKARLEAGELGTPFLAHARRLGPFPARVRDVGVVVDLASHDLDLMRWLVGSPVARVYAETARRIHTEHEDLLNGLLRFESGVVGVLDVNWLTPTKVRELSVTGERGMFVVDLLSQRLSFYENREADAHWDHYGALRGVGEGNMTQLRIETREPLLAELESFARAVAGGTPPLVSGADGRAALALALALVRSGREGAAIEPVGPSAIESGTRV